MEKFFVQLKEVLVQQENKNNRFDACGYYNTILQHRNNLQCVIDDCEKFKFDLHYYMGTDEDDGYSIGYLKLYFQDELDWAQSTVNHQYKITLVYDERHWGYCTCHPEMDQYNYVHRCCGNGCDWTAPSVHVTKIESIANFSFEGVERDMWKMQDEWRRIVSDDEERKRQAQIAHIKQEMERLQSQLSKLDAQEVSV